MCTLTIIPSQQGRTIITMNRDEHRHRHETNQVRHIKSAVTEYYHPVDQSSDGTWFGFNNYGHVMALLNRYQENNSKACKSRGTIIPDLLPLQSTSEIMSAITHLGLIDFEPFDLIYSDYESILRFSWNGKQLNKIEIANNMPYILSSSSVNMESIFAYRSKLFDSFTQIKSNKTEEKILKNFHLYQDINDTSSSVFMSREYTHTKSICQVTLSLDELSYQYYTQNNLQKRDNHMNNLRCQIINLSLIC